MSSTFYLRGIVALRGDLPKGQYSMRNCNGSVVYNGIDRVDSTVGYEPYNVVSACKVCNKCKSSMSYDEFLAFLIKAGKFQLEKRTNTSPI